MQSNHLNRLLTILKILHACFIVTILATGTVGSVIFGLIVVEPIQHCPVINIIFITFWLAFAIGLFQLLVALIFLIWFLVTFLCYSVNKQNHGTGKSSLSNLPTVAQAVGHPFGHCLGYHTNVVEMPVNLNQFSTLQRTYSISMDTLDTDFNNSNSSSSSSSSSNCCCCNCCCYGGRGRRRSKIGWLCLGSIFLVILSAGLILNIILVENSLWRLNYTLKSELASVFVEAKQAWNNSFISQTNKNDRSLACWNIIQSSYKCCGISSATDWGSRTPQTCLISDSSQTYPNGCSVSVCQSIKSFLYSARVYVITTLIFLAVTFLIDFVYTLYTAHVTLVQNKSIDRPLSQIQSNIANTSGWIDLNREDEFHPTASAGSRSRPTSDRQTNRM